MPQVLFCFGLGRVGHGEDLEEPGLESEEAGGYELCALEVFVIVCLVGFLFVWGAWF